MPRLKIKSDHCSNCGEDFGSNSEKIEFCHICGQENHDPRSPFINSISNLVRDAVQIDNRTTLSIKTILLNPGKITKDWIEGKRVRYSSPVKMFMATTALLAFNWFLLVDFNARYYTLSKENESQSQQFEQLPDSSLISISGQSSIPFIEHPKRLVSELRPLKTIRDDKISEWLQQHNIPDNFYFNLLIKGFRNRISSMLNLKTYIRKFTGYVNIFQIISLPLFALIFYFIFYKNDFYYYDSLIFNLHYNIFKSLIFLILSWPLILIAVQFELQYEIFFMLLPVSVFYLYLASDKVFGFSRISTLIRVLLFILISLFINTVRDVLIEAYLM